ncbi:hypothetical protein [Mycolicibacterium thermoresistibile]|uniref:Flagellar hook-length control protein n=2 Tax=Mycolicibacterium thermoresistibile TaxID=1797 RepID=G7CF88_MYCT3|nr:hypothetical protein [Mycolicibacterium thermoresistibile]EHI13167.1 flagellar hook-length control protein [Mycolicibacterium thermoresistibile ATCC 19527]GAT16271.1 flagellar hook-length control protein [Mycolicibacterium thermoresistibile]SNW20358.1 flagellar hook-length control protein [Mycolicibacterium thermoresistibile]
MSAQQAAIKSAMAVARDVAEGRLQPDQLDALAADECRALFGTVVGAGDALWELHVDVARQVLALGGVPANELAEWLAVTRAAEAEAEPEAEVGGSWIERALAQLGDGDEDG